MMSAKIFIQVLVTLLFLGGSALAETEMPTIDGVTLGMSLENIVSLLGPVTTENPISPEGRWYTFAGDVKNSTSTSHLSDGTCFGIEGRRPDYGAVRLNIGDNVREIRDALGEPTETTYRYLVYYFVYDLPTYPPTLLTFSFRDDCVSSISLDDRRYFLMRCY